MHKARYKTETNSSCLRCSFMNLTKNCVLNIPKKINQLPKLIFPVNITSITAIRQQSNKPIRVAILPADLITSYSTISWFLFSLRLFARISALFRLILLCRVLVTIQLYRCSEGLSRGFAKFSLQKITAQSVSVQSKNSS